MLNTSKLIKVKQNNHMLLTTEEHCKCVPGKRAMTEAQREGEREQNGHSLPSHIVCFTMFCKEEEGKYIRNFPYRVEKKN